MTYVKDKHQEMSKKNDQVVLRHATWNNYFTTVMSRKASNTSNAGICQKQQKMEGIGSLKNIPFLKKNSRQMYKRLNEARDLFYSWHSYVIGAAKTVQFSTPHFIAKFSQNKVIKTGTKQYWNICSISIWTCNKVLLNTHLHKSDIQFIRALFEILQHIKTT